MVFLGYFHRLRKAHLIAVVGFDEASAIDLVSADVTI